MSRTAREWGPVDQLIAIDGALERYGLESYRSYVSDLRDRLFRSTNTPADYAAIRGEIDALDGYFVSHGFPSPSDSVRTEAPMGSPTMNALARGETYEAVKVGLESAGESVGSALAIGSGVVVALAVGVAIYLLLDKKE